jgi:type II secretory pathway component HofQ
MTNEMFEEWIAEVMRLPEHLRNEAINRRWNELTAKQREDTVYRQQIEAKRTQARHMKPRRPRPIGPLDRAQRLMEEQYRNSR